MATLLWPNNVSKLASALSFLSNHSFAFLHHLRYIERLRAKNEQLTAALERKKAESEQVSAAMSRLEADCSALQAALRCRYARTDLARKYKKSEEFGQSLRNLRTN